MFAQFAQPAPAPPTLPNNVSVTSSASSSSRTRRLRGLSYLRSYTSTHHHPTQSSIDPSRCPETSSSPIRSSRTASAEQPSRRQRRFSITRIDQTVRSSSESKSPVPDIDPRYGEQSSSSGWVPSVGGRSGLSRTASRPQPTSTTSYPVAELATDRTSAARSNSGLVSSMVRARTSGPGPNTSEGVMPSHNSAAQDYIALNIQENGASHTNLNRQGRSTTQERHDSPGSAASPEVPSIAQTQMPSIRFIPHHDLRASRPSLNFTTVSRVLPSGTSVIRVGRYSEKDNDPNIAPGVPSAAPVGFKSKVVSRRHCELWCSSGQWYIKDVKSSSGTFLNHIRLSQPNLESKPFPLNDGDVVQLGIDFKGGEEMIFRCVKIRVECNRGWQKALNSFNTTTHKQLRNLAAKNHDAKDTTPSSECSICLLSIAPCQPLFVAPCSHVWHYKCIRPILNGPTWPQFLCPNCRAVADLEAEVDEPAELWEDEQELEASQGGEGAKTPMRPLTANGEPANVDPPSPTSDRNATLSIGNDEELAAIIGAITSANEEPYVEGPDSPLLRRHAEDFALVPRRPSRSSLASRKLDSVKALDLASRPPAQSTNRSPSTSLRPPQAESTSGIRSLHDQARGVRSTSSSRTGDRAVDSAGAEGPLTPRNDAGPFVFDGSAGRASGSDILGGLNGENGNAAQKPGGPG